MAQKTEKKIRSAQFQWGNKAALLFLWVLLKQAERYIQPHLISLLPCFWSASTPVEWQHTILTINETLCKKRDGRRKQYESHDLLTLKKCSFRRTTLLILWEPFSRGTTDWFLKNSKRFLNERPAPFRHLPTPLLLCADKRGENG